MENYLRLVTDIKNAVACNDVSSFKTLCTLLKHVNRSENCETIWNYQLNAYKNTCDIDLICLACKSSSDEVLEYLLTSENTVYSLPFAIQKLTLTPEVEDEECHNAFYYAIRSNVCSLVEILIKKWPNEPFKGNPDILDQILAEAYKDLLVRNVCINREMELYIKNKLMDLRLFDDTPTQSNTALQQTDIQHLRNLTALRLDFVLENIVLVRAQIRNSEPEELVLLSFKYIAKNIHMLKSAIVCPGNLPWEEIEFCLAIYIRQSSKRLEENLLYRLLLNKHRIASHLEHFLDILIAVKENVKTARVNKIRKLVIKDISIDKNNPKLHDDFIIIRDLHSLETIRSSIGLAMSADAAKKEGQLLITRALQVIGEHLKNTKDSPKLSDVTIEFLNSALPSDLKKIVTELRDCLSHAESLCLRSRIEENGQYFFTSMQSDISQMNLVVKEILCEKKIEVICTTLYKVLDCRDFCSMKTYFEDNQISTITLNRELDEASNISMGTIETLEKFFTDVEKESEIELSCAKKLYRQIYDILREKDYSKSMTLANLTKKMREMFEKPKQILKMDGFICEKMDTFLQNELRLMKLKFMKSSVLSLRTFLESSEIELFCSILNKLDETNKTNRENKEFKELISQWEELIDSVARCRREKIQNILSAIQEEKYSMITLQNSYREALEKIVKIFNEPEDYIDILPDISDALKPLPNTDNFFCKTSPLFEDFYKQCKEEMPKGTRYADAVMNTWKFVRLRMGKFKWIKEFQLILKDRHGSQLRKSPDEMSKFKADLKDQSAMKISTLRKLLADHHLEVKPCENTELSLNDAKLRSVMEMLVLDVTECLSDRLSNNAYFVENDCPLVNGKNFRNHLAHRNTLIDVLFGDDITNVFLNARKMVREDVLESDRKIGKKIKNDPKKSNESHLRDLEAVEQQLKLFAALSAGGKEEVEECRRKGADMKGRNLQLWTTLHFAAKGPNPELVELAIQFNPDINVADVDLQTALHIAAAHGRLTTVEYLVDIMKMDTNAVDINGRTALHFALQKGHANVVEFLLKHVTETTCRDTYGYTPLHYAVGENHIDTVNILLKKEPNHKEILTSSGLSALNLAAMKGHSSLVTTLFEKKEPDGLKPEEHFTTLHYATIGGNAEVVNFLIAQGYDVNAKDKNGMTPLHLATQHCHKEISVILLDNGADINAICFKVWTPLSYAAKIGNLELLESLMEKGANVNIVTDLDHAPLVLAASFGHYEITKTLLDGCDLNIKIKGLCVAAFKGHKSIVELFVNDGVDLNATYSKRKETALHYAASAGHKDIVNYLIENGCDVNAISESENKCEDNDFSIRIFDYLSETQHTDMSALLKNGMGSKPIHGQTALHIACRAGHREVVRCLIRNKADITIKDDAGFTPLQLMVCAKMTDILTKEKVKINTHDCDVFSLLLLGIIEHDLEFIKYCLEQGCDINTTDLVSGCTPLHAAVIVGFEDMVQHLLDNGANIDAKTQSDTGVIDFAVIANKKEVLNILINKNSTLTAEKERDLFLGAVEKGHDDIVEYFLRRNPEYALANAERDEYPLHIAVEHCHLNVLKMILDAGGDRGINDTNENGSTPLILAVRLGYSEIVQLLLLKGADPTIKTFLTYLQWDFKEGSIERKKIRTKAESNILSQVENHLSAVDHAAMCGNLDILETLLQNSRVHTNLRGQEGSDLLEFAVVAGDLESVKFLIDRGIDVNAVGFDKMVHLFLAAASGHYHIVEYFLSLGFNIHDRIDQRNLVHCAAAADLSDLCAYLYEKGLDFNALDANVYTPLSEAIKCGNSDVFHTLLHFGSCYRERYIRHVLKSDDLSLDNFVIMVSLTLVSHLFSAVCKNDVPKTEALLSTAQSFSKYGLANVRNSKNISLLHYAACKGYGDIVDILLKYGANPKAVNKEKSPLHYASKFSHGRIVITLLSHGAVFNAVCDSGKTPLDYATDLEVWAILNDLEKMFTKIQNGEAVFQILADIKSLESRRVYQGARNTDGATLLDLAIARNHPEVELLKTVFPADVPDSVSNAEKFNVSTQSMEESELQYPNFIFVGNPYNDQINKMCLF